MPHTALRSVPMPATSLPSCPQPPAADMASSIVAVCSSPQLLFSPFDHPVTSFNMKMAPSPLQPFFVNNCAVQMQAEHAGAWQQRWGAGGWGPAACRWPLQAVVVHARVDAALRAARINMRVLLQASPPLPTCLPISPQVSLVLQVAHCCAAPALNSRVPPNQETLQLQARRTAHTF
jgi:hypothetical protein